MKAIMVMYDSLNRRMLSPYGCDWVSTPNFERLAQRALTFDNFYVGSLPCMPARRDLHTGRYNFLHRSWSPLEPFDDSMPEILKNNGIYTRLISDHYHYWEDGGCTYHSRYSSWDCIRGQEADTWTDMVASPEIPDHLPTMREFTHPVWWEDSFKNKSVVHSTNEWPQDKVFDSGLAFLEKNKDEDNWFLQIETFDPHEPFDSPEEFRKMYEDGYDGPLFDWPPYAPVSETDEQVNHIRNRYAALMTMCDRNLGRILDYMDANDMWKDTMLIVNTDHGFLLGEKDWWAKSVMPCYNELANTPFFIYHPDMAKGGEHRQSLAQSIDIPATLLDCFGQEIPKDMQGKSLMPVIKDDSKVRDYGLFGFHGSFINVTDGDYVYMKSSASVSNTPLNEYTLFPTRQQFFISNDELSRMESHQGFDFTKGCRVMKIPNGSRLKNATFCNSFQYGDKLFNLTEDPEQLNAIEDYETEARMLNAMIRLMKDTDAPLEQYTRMGISKDIDYKTSDVEEMKSKGATFESFEVTAKYEWTEDAKQIFIGMLSLIPENRVQEYFERIDKVMDTDQGNLVKRQHFEPIAEAMYSEDQSKVFYFLNKLTRIH